MIETNLSRVTTPSLKLLSPCPIIHSSPIHRRSPVPDTIDTWQPTHLRLLSQRSPFPGTTNNTKRSGQTLSAYNQNSAGHISKASGFKIIGNGSLGYWSRETIHSSSCHCNEYVISYDESLEVSADNGRHGYRYLETSHSSSHNHVVYNSGNNGRGVYRYQDISHSYSCNCVIQSVDDVRCGYRYQETIHSYSRNHGASVVVGGRDVYV